MHYNSLRAGVQQLFLSGFLADFPALAAVCDGGLIPPDALSTPSATDHLPRIQYPGPPNRIRGMQHRQEWPYRIGNDDLHTLFTDRAATAALGRR